jgi:hypothetical protein
MTIIGIFLYTLSSVTKFSLNKDGNNLYTRLKFAFKINFVKGNVLSILSVLQLLGVLWIGFGYLESLMGTLVTKIPGTLFFAIELFLPLGLAFFIAQYKMK